MDPQDGILPLLLLQGEGISLANPQVRHLHHSRGRDEAKIPQHRLCLQPAGGTGEREKEAAETGRSWEAEDKAKARCNDEAKARWENEAEVNRKAETKARHVDDKARLMVTGAKNHKTCNCTWIGGCTCGAAKTQDEAESKGYHICNCTWN